MKSNHVPECVQIAGYVTMCVQRPTTFTHRDDNEYMSVEYAVAMQSPVLEAAFSTCAFAEVRNTTVPHSIFIRNGLAPLRSPT